MNKPSIRLIHHLACSGGTIITKAIAAMESVVLLSEQHPEQAMARRTDPVKQAQAAGVGITDDEIADRFVRDIGLVSGKCAAAGKTLVVRDHANRDFMGTKRLELVTERVLGERFELVSICTVRHPLDIWLGLRAMGWYGYRPGEFMERYAAFARIAADRGYVRYESFVELPDRTLGQMCEALTIRFDMDWREKLSTVTHMTGASGRSSDVIAERPRRPVEDAVIDQFERDEHYHESLDLLGYEPARRAGAA